MADHDSSSQATPTRVPASATTHPASPTEAGSTPTLRGPEGNPSADQAAASSLSELGESAPSAATSVTSTPVPPPATRPAKPEVDHGPWSALTAADPRQDLDAPAEPTLVDFNPHADRSAAQAEGRSPGGRGAVASPAARPTSAARSTAPASGPGQPGVATRAGRRRKRWLAVSIVLVVLIALIGVAVGIGEQQARSIATERAQAALSSSLGGPVHVTIHDNLVLLALARNTFDHVSGSADQLQLNGQGQKLTVTDVTFEAYGISEVLGQAPISVSSLTAKAVVSYAEITRISGVTMKSGGGGRVVVDQKIDILGAAMTVAISAVPGVDSATGKLTLTDPQADVGGVPIPQAILSPLLNKLTEKVALPSAPGMRYEKLTAGPDGFTVNLAGSNLLFPR